MKRLYFDLETSPNLVYTWRLGYRVALYPENLVKERAIICVAWKWNTGKRVRALKWDKGCDKKLLEEFIPIANEADQIVAHNGDRFDIKWLRSRCIFHRIPMFPRYHSLDTLKQARQGFNFNSNKLDYIAKFLGKDGKRRHDGFQMWKEVCEGDKKALTAMVQYCKQDIRVLEDVHREFENYSEPTIHVGVVNGGPRWSCPKCGSTEIGWTSESYVSKTGMKAYYYQCRECDFRYKLGQTLAFQSPHPPTAKHAYDPDQT